MPEEYEIDFGLASSVVARTYGKPGNRTFNVTAQSKVGEVVVWMEKEHLIGVGMAIEENLKRPSGITAAVPDDSGGTDTPVNLEFKATSITLGYNILTKVFSLSAKMPIDTSDEDDENDEEEGKEVRFGFLETTAVNIAKEIARIASGGRPICPYCESPTSIEEKHSCSRRNGHLSITNELP